MLESSFFLAIVNLLIVSIGVCIPGLLLIKLITPSYSLLINLSLGRYVGVAGLSGLFFIWGVLGLPIVSGIYIAFIIIILVVFWYKHGVVRFNDIYTTVSLSIENFIGVFNNYSLYKKTLTVVLSFYIIIYLVTGLIAVSVTPSHSDDSFQNWNRPIIQIQYDQGFEIMGTADELLGRGRVGYPIHIASLKAVLSDLTGGYNDILSSQFQRIGFLMLILYSIGFVRRRTSDPLLSLLGPVLICSIPLVFIHTTSSYHDLLMAGFMITTLGTFINFMENKNPCILLLFGVLLGGLSIVKNEGLVLGVPVILLSIILYLLYNKTLVTIIKDHIEGLVYSFVSFTIIAVPFISIKLFNGIGRNQATSLQSGTGITSTFRREIFNGFGTYYFGMDNYGIILIFVVWGILLLLHKLFKSKSDCKQLLFFLGSFGLFAAFMVVFLLTDAAEFVLNQTTIHRVSMICMVVYLSMMGWYVADDA